MYYLAIQFSKLFLWWYKTIVTILHNWGFKKVGMSTVSRIFNNKFYMGIMISKKYPEEVKGQHVPMITEEQFYRVQAILRGRDPNKIITPHKVHDNKDFPLRVLMRCGKCDTPFTGAWSKGSHAQYGYYFCRKRCVTTSIATNTLDIDFKKLLNRFTPIERGIQLYCKLLLNIYSKKRAKLQKTKNAAEEEIEKLKALRQMLVEKNLNGTYSDDIFREQNNMIEENMIVAQNAKNDALIDKYNIDKITQFIKRKISNLEETYTNPKNDLIVIRSFLRSIFISGFTWNYPGCSNDTISPIYQSILDVEEKGLPIGDPTASQFEPTLAWLEHLRLIYDESDEK